MAANLINSIERALDGFPITVKQGWLNKCKDALWERWTTEYLRSLRERHNQSKGTKTVKLNTGDVVIIKSEEKNRGKWQLGVVDKLHLGRDGIVRAVRLQAGKSFLCDDEWFKTQETYSII